MQVHGHGDILFIFKQFQTKYIADILQIKRLFMHSRFIEIRKQIGKFIANFSVTEEDGKEYIFDGEIIREGLEISTYDENGDIVPLPDGEYTIQGVKVKVVEGRVSELPEKESKVETKPETEMQEQAQTQEQEEPTPNPDEKETQLSDALNEIERLKAENESLKKELEQIKSVPMAEPVPQRTNMSSESDKEVSENVKGTKFETACRLFGK